MVEKKIKNELLSKNVCFSDLDHVGKLSSTFQNKKSHFLSKLKSTNEINQMNQSFSPKALQTTTS
jgi:hypothetical protein